MALIVVMQLTSILTLISALVFSVSSLAQIYQLERTGTLIDKFERHSRLSIGKSRRLIMHSSSFNITQPNECGNVGGRFRANLGFKKYREFVTKFNGAYRNSILVNNDFAVRSPYSILSVLMPGRPLSRKIVRAGGKGWPEFLDFIQTKISSSVKVEAGIKIRVQRVKNKIRVHFELQGSQPIDVLLGDNVSDSFSITNGVLKKSKNKFRYKTLRVKNRKLFVDLEAVSIANGSKLVYSNLNIRHHGPSSGKLSRYLPQLILCSEL